MAKKRSMEMIKIDDILIIGKLSDGTFRQVLATKEDTDRILAVLTTTKGSVRVNEDILDWLRFERPSNDK